MNINEDFNVHKNSFNQIAPNCVGWWLLMPIRVQACKYFGKQIHWAGILYLKAGSYFCRLKVVMIKWVYIVDLHVNANVITYNPQSLQYCTYTLSCKLCGSAGFHSEHTTTCCLTTHGLASRWVYVARTIPNIGHLLQPLEELLRTKFIPSLTGCATPSDMERELLALPDRLGLGLLNLLISTPLSILLPCKSHSL